MTKGAAVGVQGEDRRRKDTALGGSSADGQRIGDVSPASCADSCQTGPISAGRACLAAEQIS